jgi:septum formation topological specificity factor MinE
MTPSFKPKIVLIYDKNTDCFKDKSDTIESLRREAVGVFIKYRGSDREYKYGHQNVLVLTLKESPDVAVNDIFIDEEQQSGITAIGNG